jgi:CubicO group peptidase (beta-lactamase class C family)
MKCTRHSLCVSAFAFIVGVMPLEGQRASDELEQFVDRLASENLLSMSVAVVRDDEVLLAKGYGLADRENGIPNTSSTMFRIGSVTKQFTAMAILILQEDGLLRVGDPLGKYLSDVPDSWKPLTIHQLLTHTSGLMHSWALPAFGQRMAEVRSFREVIRDFYEQPFQFEPGQGYGYSGLGYFLLARLIEEVSGQTYEAFLRARIFDPLGMNNTGADRPGLSADRHARGYAFADNTYEEAPPVHMPIMTGGGNLYSTVEDMVRWDRALRRHDLISDSSYEALYTPEKENYAYGWFVRTNNGHEVIEHSGGVPGFAAFIARYPDAGVSVIVLSNLAGGVGAVAHAIAREVLGGAESSIARREVSHASFFDWTGTSSPVRDGSPDRVRARHAGAHER